MNYRKWWVLFALEILFTAPKLPQMQDLFLVRNRSSNPPDIGDFNGSRSKTTLPFGVNFQTKMTNIDFPAPADDRRSSPAISPAGKILRIRDPAIWVERYHQPSTARAQRGLAEAERTEGERYQSNSSEQINFRPAQLRSIRFQIIQSVNSNCIKFFQVHFSSS